MWPTSSPHGSSTGAPEPCNGRSASASMATRYSAGRTGRYDLCNGRCELAYRLAAVGGREQLDRAARNDQLERHTSLTLGDALDVGEHEALPFRGIWAGH